MQGSRFLYKPTIFARNQWPFCVFPFSPHSDNLPFSKSIFSPRNPTETNQNYWQTIWKKSPCYVENLVRCKISPFQNIFKNPHDARDNCSLIWGKSSRVKSFSRRKIMKAEWIERKKRNENRICSEINKSNNKMNRNYWGLKIANNQWPPIAKHSFICWMEIFQWKSLVLSKSFSA